MNTLVILLRVIHLFGGVFWVGFALFNVAFLQPTIRGTGPDGQKVMQYLSQKTRLLPLIYAAATLTMLSGLALYWIDTGFRADAMAMGSGLVLGIGGLAGIIAWSYAVLVIRGIFNQMGAIGQAIQAQGTPPTAEQSGQMQALVMRLGKAGKVAVTFMIVALLAMAAARYTGN